MRLFIARILQSLATLGVLSFAVYMLIGLMPGDPVDLMASGNPKLTPEDIARLRGLYGLDQPLTARYGHWLSAALHGDFGYSRVYNLPVFDVIGPRMLHTLALIGASLLVTLLLSLPLGVYAAKWRGRAADRAVNLFCLAGLSLPSFWTGLLLICLFAVHLGWLPAAADLSSGDFAQQLKSMALPVLTLSIGGFAMYVRHLRAAMIDALQADYIKTARAKGCSDTRILWRHAFRNALPPVVTLFMLDLGTLFGGALTVETVFAFPGMGKLMFDAVMGNDYNLALCCFLALAAFVLIANALADLCNALLDPRQETAALKEAGA